MITVSRAALAAAIDRALGDYPDERAETRMFQHTFGVDDVVAVYADSHKTLFGVMMYFQAEHGLEAAEELQERLRVERLGIGVIAYFECATSEEPVEGPGSVRHGNGGYIATSKRGCEMTFEDEVTAWEFAASETY